MNTLTGLIPVLITPLDKNLKLDLLSLKKILNFINKYEPCAFWANGTGSEDMSLSLDNRLLLTKKICEYNKNKVPVISGCSFYSVEDTFEFLKKSKSFDISGYHYLPYNQMISLSNLKLIYHDLAKYSSKPIWLYTSANWYKHISPDFIDDLKSIKNIAGVKYSTSNIVDIQSVQSLADKRFQVISAVVKTLYSCMCLGVKASTTVELFTYPTLINKIRKSFLEGEYKQSLFFQNRLNTLIKKMPNISSKQNFLKVAEIKYLLSKKKICKKFVTKPYKCVDSSKEKKLLDNFYNKHLNELF
jgi:dihydrodipicolinate synthase/N-acetylneuraminate lyase